MSDADKDVHLTHLDQQGRARMVDVGSKEPTARRAVARCKVFMASATLQAIRAQDLKKGDVLAVARVAGIQAAKRTSDMIPLCHPLMLTKVGVNCEVQADHVAVQAEVEVYGPTGVEMEALHACSVAALTVFDMCKGVDKSMVISDLTLWEKTGGKSGTYLRVP